jgi:hypothetical protein
MMTTKPDHYALLAACARIRPDEQEQQTILGRADRISDWNTLVSDAEGHAIAPLLYTSLRESGFNIPLDAKRKLYALVQRTAWANEVRARVMVEILQACESRDIPLAVLKGSFLAHSIYPDPSLRTMSDIDLLAPPDQAQAVQETLAELGFTVPQQALSRYMSEHHHLPGASLQRDGLTVSVEVHHDALSGDAPASITFDNLTTPLQTYRVGSHEAQALGHQDQLRHLFHHMSEPASRLKLIWCTDIVYYASHFHEEVDWQALQRSYPAVVNALRVVDSVLPLPVNLAAYRMARGSSPLKSAGQSIQPLSSLLRLPFRQRMRGLLAPSPWWLHLYYGVAPHRSLLTTRLLRHPLTVLRWVIRRLRASMHGRQE